MTLTIQEEEKTLPASIGKLQKGTGLKEFINRNWKDPSKRKEIIACFHKYGLDIIEVFNKGNKLEKRVVFYADSIRVELEASKAEEHDESLIYK